MVELVGGGQPGGSGAHHRHLLAGAVGSVPGLHFPQLEALLDNAQLVVPDGDGVLVEMAQAGPLAGGGTHPAGELGEVVGLQQPGQGVAPVARHDHIVPLGDQVVEGAAEDAALPLDARLTVGYAAVHAPAPLLPPDGLRHGEMETLPVPDPLLRRTAGCLLPLIFQKSCDLSHFSHPLLTA